MLVPYLENIAGSVSVIIHKATALEHRFGPETKIGITKPGDAYAAIVPMLLGVRRTLVKGAGPLSTPTFDVHHFVSDDQLSARSRWLRRTLRIDGGTASLYYVTVIFEGGTNVPLYLRTVFRIRNPSFLTQNSGTAPYLAMTLGHKKSTHTAYSPKRT